jgi:hypothetical protein
MRRNFFALADFDDIFLEDWKGNALISSFLREARIVGSQEQGLPLSVNHD